MNSKNVTLAVAAFAIGLIHATGVAQTNTFPSSGNVGIGTTGPGTPLQVVGTGNVISAGEANNSDGRQLILGVNSTGDGYGTIQSVHQGSAYTPIALNPNGGNIGIGTGNPQTKLEIDSNDTWTISSIRGFSSSSPNAGPALLGYRARGTMLAPSYIQSGDAIFAIQGRDGVTDATWPGISIFATENHTATAQGARIDFSVVPNGTTNTANAMTLQQNGNVGVGTTSPAYKLDVSGAIRSTAGGVIYPDGTSQTTAWTGVLCGGDYAEAVDAAGSAKNYEPGDVLVLGNDGKGEVHKSAKPYSTLVAGIYATKPGALGRRQTLAENADEVPMAMVGIVPTKVIAEGGPIHRGDLLVTSSRAGYAMKGTQRSKMLGAVLGKAMGDLNSGSGVIEVLVTLQ